MEENMSSKFSTLLIAMLAATACGTDDKDTAVEPSSEPSSDTTDTTDTTDTQTSYTISPDYLLFSVQNGYVANDIAPVMFAGATEAFSGAFSAILFDSAAGDYCAIDWTFDVDSSAADEDFADGSVADGFNQGSNLTAWYGFLVNSTPVTRGSCDALDSSYDAGFQTLMSEVPGFGYGPLTADLQGSMETEHPAGWSNVQGSVFAGIISLTLGGADRMYFAVNEAYAYKLTDGVPAWDPTNQDMPQGTEMSIDDVPYAEGFYFSSYYFGLNAAALAQ